MKPRNYDVKSTSYNRFASCLTKGEQFCYYGGVKSSRSILKCDITQDSCLGPVVLLLYSNEFENCLENMTPHVYADNACLTIASE